MSLQSECNNKVINNIQVKPLFKEKGDAFICCEDIVVRSPTYNTNGSFVLLTPTIAKRHSLSYDKAVYADVVTRKDSPTGVEVNRQKSVYLGNLPLMMMSTFCNLPNDKNVSDVETTIHTETSLIEKLAEAFLSIYY